MLSEDLFTNQKLLPLLDDSSVVLFQLFVLEIFNKKTQSKEYKIIYGWCIKSTRAETEDVWHCRNESKELYSTNEISYSTYKISLYNKPRKIIQLLNRFAKHQSLKNASNDLDIDSKKINFDLFFIKNEEHGKQFAPRPIIFNETTTIISRHFYEKYSLYSPFKNVPSFSLIINNLNKLSLMQDSEGMFYQSWKVALSKILTYLSDETTMSFDSSGAARFGNIELINSQCSDEFELHSVWFENLSETVNIHYRDLSFSKKVKVTILSNKTTCNRNLLINCFLTNGGQVILDECKPGFHEGENEFTIEFESLEPFSQMSVSIWVEHEKEFQIFFKHSSFLARTISTNMGMVGTSGVIKSEWLETIKGANSKTIMSVNEAQNVSKTSYSQMTMGNYDTDPWVTADRNFSELVAKINPPKSEAEFFSKGWDNVAEEHGAISFLNWFKKIVEHAQEVVIQDPFFDTLGLEFLARTTNTNTDFKILTCTQVTSGDDTAIKGSEPNRSIRIKKFIETNATILDSVKFQLYDLRSNGGGDRNLLHDRYLLIFSDNTLEKGFHLSNSIQGATKSNPLLITPIPADILEKVNQHLDDLINGPSSGNDISIVPLRENKTTEFPLYQDLLPADQIFYEELKNRIRTEQDVNEENLLFLKNKILDSGEQSSFIEMSTLGYFVAHTNYTRELFSKLQEIHEPALTNRIVSYLEACVSESFPIGFSTEITHARDMYHLFYKDSFTALLTDAFHHQNYFGETRAFSNWGASYFSRILLATNFSGFLELSRFLIKKIETSTTLSADILSLHKLSSILFNQLVGELYFRFDIGKLRTVLKCEEACLRATAAAALITNATSRNEIDRRVAMDLLSKNLPIEEALEALCKMLLKTKRQRNDVDEKAESELFEFIFETLSINYSNNNLEVVIKNTLDSYYPDIEFKVNENILIKLADQRKITLDDLFALWKVKFDLLLQENNTYSDYSSVLEITAGALLDVSNSKYNEVIKEIERICKNCFFEIRQPFKKNSTKWDHAFQMIFIIQSLLCLLEIVSKRKHLELPEELKIANLIDQISILNHQFKPYKTGQIQTLAELNLNTYLLLKQK